MTRSGLGILLMASLLTDPAGGTEKLPALCPDRPGELTAAADSGPQNTARITGLSDAGEPVLADGTVLHLTDILYADRLGALSDADRQALAVTRHASLTALIEDGILLTCRLEPDRDRYGRLSGDAGTPDSGPLLRAHLLSEGLAVVLPRAESRACCADLYRLEDEARRTERGLWALSRAPYQKVDPKTGAAIIPDRRFAVVEGRIRSIGDRDYVIYLNFGFDWNRDFTVSLTKRLFEPTELDRILTLIGKRVRVRGMADPWSGGRIAVTSPDQIEVLR